MHAPVSILPSPRRSWVDRLKEHGLLKLLGSLDDVAPFAAYTLGDTERSQRQEFEDVLKKLGSLEDGIERAGACCGSGGNGAQRCRSCRSAPLQVSVSSVARAAILASIAPCSTSPIRSLLLCAFSLPC